MPPATFLPTRCRFPCCPRPPQATIYGLRSPRGRRGCSSGRGVVAVNVPDSEGHLDDVALGYADPADYIGDGPCSGKVPGRFANRIARGIFEIDGLEYHLPINNGPNSNHGGS